MAIDQTGATMTGMLNKKPVVPQAPDLSALPAPKANDTAMPVEKPNVKEPLNSEFPDATSMEIEFAERAKTLTDEDQAVIQSVLSPSVRQALEKIIPEFKPVMDAYGSNEPNVVLPLSAISSFATQKYGITDPQEAVNSFLTEVTATMGQPMETNNVPPSQANESNGLMTSPQNMETV